MGQLHGQRDGLLDWCSLETSSTFGISSLTSGIEVTNNLHPITTNPSFLMLSSSGLQRRHITAFHSLPQTSTSPTPPSRASASSSTNFPSLCPTHRTPSSKETSRNTFLGAGRVDTARLCNDELFIHPSCTNTPFPLYCLCFRFFGIAQDPSITPYDGTLPFRAGRVVYLSRMRKGGLITRPFCTNTPFP